MLGMQCDFHSANLRAAGKPKTNLEVLYELTISQKPFIDHSTVSYPTHLNKRQMQLKKRKLQ